MSVSSVKIRLSEVSLQNRRNYSLIDHNPMINEVILDQRLTSLERQVAEIQSRLTGGSDPNWLGKISGSISDEEAFLEALELGRAFRQADRPQDDSGKQP
jgi:hypothetical protein